MESLQAGNYEQCWEQLNSATLTEVDYRQLVAGIGLFFAGYKTPIAVINHRPPLMAHFTVAQEQKLAAILDIVTTQNLSENFARHTATLGNIQGTAVNRSLVKESLVTLLTGACMNGWKNLANQYPEAFQTAYRQRERFGHAMFTLDDFTELRKLSEQTAPFSSGRTPP